MCSYRPSLGTPNGRKGHDCSRMLTWASLDGGRGQGCFCRLAKVLWTEAGVSDVLEGPPGDDSILICKIFLFASNATLTLNADQLLKPL